MLMAMAEMLSGILVPVPLPGRCRVMVAPAGTVPLVVPVPLRVSRSRCGARGTKAPAWSGAAAGAVTAAGPVAVTADATAPVGAARSDEHSSAHTAALRRNSVMQTPIR